MTTAVRFRDVSRHFGEVKAIDGVDLCVAPGEFFAMLGPSGSGKTTCLRLVAGFEQPTSGEIDIFGQPSSRIPPYRRPVNTVFQDYALFPHLNVIDNVAYGPMVAGMPRAQRVRAAHEMLELVALSGFGERRPSELSGGQRQRVALARALINKPQVLLLDEPLGALDLKLREQMQVELKSLQRRLGITFIFVTHDQGEALSMADRVAVFDHGRIQQIGSPEDIYDRPETPFVADFVGSSNVLHPDLVQRICGIRAHASLRPEAIQIGQDGYPATVTAHAFLGAATRVTLDLGGEAISVLLPKGAVLPAVGNTVQIGWDDSALHIMETPGG